MITASRNQLFNVRNNAQGDTKKVLTVCSAGLLRSATLANFLVKEYGYNVRNCGTVESYALVPISQALVAWADEIVFVNKENFEHVEDDLRDFLTTEGMGKIKVLDIPDMYNFNDPKLVEICREQYQNAQNNQNS
jgi:predicted protein tyrosine phosphatase